MDELELFKRFQRFTKSFEALARETSTEILGPEEMQLFLAAILEGKIREGPVQIYHFHNANVQMETTMSTGDDRSVHAGGNITNAVVQTGDGNVATFAKTQLPDPASVDISRVLAELREALGGLDGVEAGKVGRALDDAEEEVAKSEPDKAEVADIVTRALNYAKRTADFAGHIEKIKPLVVQIAGWVGAASPFVVALLAAVGLPVG